MVKVPFLLRLSLALVGLVFLGWTTAGATTISGDLYSLNDTDSDGKFNYRFDYTVTNTEGQGIQEAILYLSDLGYSQLALLASPTDWIDFAINDPVDDGFGGIAVEGAVDVWTNGSGGNSPIPAGGTGLFSAGFEHSALDFWNPAHYSGQVWYVDGATEYISPVSIAFHPYDGGVTPVPEPGTLFLLGTGLMGLVGISRRRRK